jgi:arylsulfatase A-like enzyme
MKQMKQYELIALALLALNSHVYSQPAAGRPNIILLFIDDLGYGDTGPFGCTDIPTPNINRLAEEGTTFTQLYVTNPPCCPSRSSLMMGMYGQSFGKYGMSRDLPIPEDKPTLAEFLRDGGYVTGQIGKWDLGSIIQGPSSRGFMEVAENLPAFTRFQYKTIEGDTAWLTEANGDQMIEFVDRNKEKPFFLYWSPLAVHSPSNNVPERLAARTTASGKRRDLGGCIVSVDDQLGKLLAFLDEHKLRENTMIIFSSDNGPNLEEGGTASPYRGGKGAGTRQIGWTLSPTIISWPGVIPQGKRFEGLSCTLDFYATIASATGIPAPEHIQGVDIFPYLTDEKQGDPHEYLFWLNNDPNDPSNRHLVAVRWKQWRLYRRHEEDTWQLFDLFKDPKEENNVAARFPEVVDNMDRHHHEWKTTHQPPKEIPKIRAGSNIPTGYGWVITDGRLEMEHEIVQE